MQGIICDEYFGPFYGTLYKCIIKSYMRLANTTLETCTVHVCPDYDMLSIRCYVAIKSLQGTMAIIYTYRSLVRKYMVVKD